jgi:tetratricopeptide (TPR) repeat protein
MNPPQQIHSARCTASVRRLLCLAAALATVAFATPVAAERLSLAAADRYYAKGDLVPAIDAYKALLSKHVHNAAVRKGLVLSLLEADRWKAAKTVVQNAPPDFKARATYHELAGLVLFREGEIDAAEAEFEKAVEMGAGEVALIGLARIADSENRPGYARKLTERALARNPTYPRCYLMLAGLSAEEGKLPEAGDELQKFIDLNQFDSDPDEVGSIGVPQQLWAFRGDKLGATAIVSGPDRCELGMTLGLIGIPQVKLSIGGEEVKFILDSGASENVLAKDFADKLGLKPISKGTTWGMGGEAERWLGKLPRLTIGEFEIANIPISIIELPQILKLLGGGIAGVLSPQSFTDLVFTLDYPKKKLVVERKTAASSRLADILDKGSGDFEDEGVSRSIIPYRSLGGEFITEVKINDLSPKLALFDTGAGAIILSDALIGKAFERNQLSPALALMAGVGEKGQAAKMASDVRLSLDTMEFDYDHVVVADLSVLGKMGCEVYAVLSGGMVSDKRVTFDTEHQRIILERGLGGKDERSESRD